jgi:hypothetical protein
MAGKMALLILPNGWLRVSGQKQMCHLWVGNCLKKICGGQKIKNIGLA